MNKTRKTIRLGPKPGMHNAKSMSVIEGKSRLTGELGVAPDTTKTVRALVNEGEARLAGELGVPDDTTSAARVLGDEGKADLTEEPRALPEEEFFVIADVDEHLYAKIVGASSINVVVCLLALRSCC